MFEPIWIALLGMISGLMIGCIGIGGVILVPALVFLAGITIQVAIPAAMMSYILSGLVATTVFAKTQIDSLGDGDPTLHRSNAGGICRCVGR